MPTATCPSEEELKAYARGALPLQCEDSLANHLDSCPRCEATVQIFERQGDPQRVVRFKREMKAIGQLDHTHIVRGVSLASALELTLEPLGLTSEVHDDYLIITALPHKQQHRLPCCHDLNCR